MMSDSIIQPTFTVNDYDRDGDVNVPGVFLHFGETRVRVADSLEGFKDFIQQIANIRQELIDEYGAEL